MHRHSYAKADTPIMRDLVVLQRSRSLRDPSMSPSLWNSSSVFDFLSCPAEKAAFTHQGRSSISIEQPVDARRLRESSEHVAITSASRISPCKMPRLSLSSNGNNNPNSPAGKNSVTKNTVRSYLRGCEEHSLGIDEEEETYSSVCVKHGKNKLKEDEHPTSHRSVSKNSEIREKGNGRKDARLKTLSNVYDKEGKEFSDSIMHRRFHSKMKSSKVHGSNSKCSKGRSQKLRCSRKNRVTASSVVGNHNELFIAGNSPIKGASRSNHAERIIHRDSGNGCGIPWNWSSIHHRGKNILDLAGRSFSCGLADSRLKNGGLATQENDEFAQSDRSSSSPKHEGDALPLLVEASGSHRSAGSDSWARDYSKELEICRDHFLKHNFSSSLASEASSGMRFDVKRHQNLTQKYMPRTFRDLAGQALVAQVLLNLVSKKRVGLLYVFYGPHGAGKTSCARIFSRVLNCQSIGYPKPCNACHYCIGKSHAVREFGPGSSFEYQNIMDILEDMVSSLLPSQYVVLIFDDCDCWPTENWNIISKVLDRASRNVVFIFITSSVDLLPHIITSRCQKFFFPKLKDMDIIHTLQKIVVKEDLNIDKDALKLIASRSDGSLRAAEMTLEQLSLLGRQITVPLVQQLVGLISDNVLVDLLDLALSADAVSTVKRFRDIIESGVDPIDLMSQLATIITDILAGSYDLTCEGRHRRFFRGPELSKDDVEKLGRALKTLSDAEKQLRMSNDKSTWLTAALLQFIPDQQYRLPSSFMESTSENNWARKNVKTISTQHNDLTNNRIGKSSSIVRGLPISLNTDKDLKRIWLEALEKIEVDNIKEFMHREGRLTAVTIGSAAKVQLLFISPISKQKAEKLKQHVLPAFESVLGLPILFELISEPRQDKNGATTSHAAEAGTSEIMEITDSPRHQTHGISLAHAIQHSGERRSRGKTGSIAEKLEQENMKLEPRSRGFLCWKTSKASPRKLSRHRRTRKSRSILKGLSCGKCISSVSSR